MIDDDEDPETMYNHKAPILLKDFEYDGCTMNKSFLIKQNDLGLALYVLEVWPPVCLLRTHLEPDP